MMGSTVRINTKKMTGLVIYIVASSISLVIAWIIRKYKFTSWTQVFSCLILFEFVVQLLVYKIIKVKFASVYGLISLFSYVFQFGATVCYALGFERNLWDLRFAYWATSYAYINGNTIALSCVVAFSLGGLIIYCFTNNYDISLQDNTYSTTPFCYYRFLGYSLCLACFPLYLYMIYYSISAIVLGGSYTALAEQRLPGYITSFAKFLYVGIIVLIYYYHEKESRLLYYFYLLLFLLLVGLQMMTGIRSEPMTILFAFVIFYFNCIKKGKSSLKRTVLVAAGAFLLANLLYSIQISRNSGFSISDIITSFFSNGFGVILYEFSEFGGSAMTTMVVTDRINEVHPTWFFIKEFLSLSPIAIQSEYGTVASVAAGAQELGTTYVGEMFFYFGHFCYIACFLIAIYITKIEKFIYDYAKKKDYIVFFMCLMWMWQEINCIRASFNMGVKTFIYSFVLFTGIKWMYNSVRGKLTMK